MLIFPPKKGAHQKVKDGHQLKKPIIAVCHLMNALVQAHLYKKYSV